MEKESLSKELWQTANLITGFAVAQTVLFTYACANPPFAQLISTFRVKTTIASHLVVIAVAEIYAVWWCARKAAALLDGHRSRDDTEAASYDLIASILRRVAWGRIVVIIALLAPTFLALYAGGLGGMLFGQ